MADAKQFAHRENANGTWDAICRRCFRTAARGATETELIKTVSMHDCDPNDLAFIDYRRSVVKAAMKLAAQNK